MQTRLLALFCAVAVQGYAFAADPGVTGTEILLGMVNAQSGAASGLGTGMRAGAEAVFKEANAQGGVHGRRIRLLVDDDAYEPDRAIDATLRMIEERQVFALFGYVGTPTDALLKAVALRLKAAVREGDTIARLGGDEFVVMLTALSVPAHASEVAEKIIATFAEPFDLEGHELRVTTSVGISIYPEDGDTGETLLKTADAALYGAKDKGRNCFMRYTADMGVKVEEKAAIENALHLAIARNELELHYQPKVNLRSGQIYGVEALVRWRRPGVGMVPPNRFIPLAEETGLILPIGEWVLRAACAQAKLWHLAGHRDLTVAVNVSPRQFKHQNVPQLVRDVLADTGLDARYLELELTESVLMQDREKIVADLQQVKTIGVKLSLDDFGTGYSSLSYLKTIIAMAESLSMATVAEGVETEGQLGFLNANRCDAMQGYFFSRPLPGDQLSELLTSGAQLPASRHRGSASERTLLIVDDEQMVLTSLEAVLRSDGYRILTTPDPAQALELLAIHHVGVIVADQRMPGMSGKRVAATRQGIAPENGAHHDVRLHRVRVDYRCNQ